LLAATTSAAAVATMAEHDGTGDKDRGKSLGYGYSFQYPRKRGVPTSTPGFAQSGLEERMRVLYKFLTGCRGARSGAPADTGKCWPCPTDAAMSGEWSALAGFRTDTYGPLYPIQAQSLITAVIEDPSPGLVPAVNALGLNRPNPFNPETTIPYSLAQAGHVAIKVYDVRGRLVRTLLDSHLPAGWHDVRWNGQDGRGGTAASGLYFCRITYPDGTASARKLMMLR
jgi:hypothetical protein